MTTTNPPFDAAPPAAPIECESCGRVFNPPEHPGAVLGHDVPGEGDAAVAVPSSCCACVREAVPAEYVARVEECAGCAAVGGESL